MSSRTHPAVCTDSTARQDSMAFQGLEAGAERDSGHDVMSRVECANPIEIWKDCRTQHSCAKSRAQTGHEFWKKTKSGWTYSRNWAKCQAFLFV
jgi:hypothetical protein